MTIYKSGEGPGPIETGKPAEKAQKGKGKGFGEAVSNALHKIRLELGELFREIEYATRKMGIGKPIRKYEGFGADSDQVKAILEKDLGKIKGNLDAVILKVKDKDLSKILPKVRKQIRDEVEAIFSSTSKVDPREFATSKIREMQKTLSKIIDDLDQADWGLVIAKGKQAKILKGRTERPEKVGRLAKGAASPALLKYAEAFGVTKQAKPQAKPQNLQAAKKEIGDALSKYIESARTLSSGKGVAPPVVSPKQDAILKKYKAIASRLGEKDHKEIELVVKGVIGLVGKIVNKKRKEGAEIPVAKEPNDKPLMDALKKLDKLEEALISEPGHKPSKKTADDWELGMSHKRAAKPSRRRPREVPVTTGEKASAERVAARSRPSAGGEALLKQKKEVLNLISGLIFFANNVKDHPLRFYINTDKQKKLGELVNMKESEIVKYSPSKLTKDVIKAMDYVKDGFEDYGVFPFQTQIDKLSLALSNLKRLAKAADEI